jgi:hypothetical protein
MAKKRPIAPIKDKRLLIVCGAVFGLVVAFFTLAAIVRF